MKDNIKIHVRQMKSVLLEQGANDKRLTIRPSLQQMKDLNIEHYKGKQYRYFYFVCDKKERERLLNECLIDLPIQNPKDDDLSWRKKDIDTGKWIPCQKPKYITDIDQRTKNIVNLKRGN